MVQIIDLPQRYQDVMGQQLAQGLSKNFAPPEFYVQQRQQQGALNNFKQLLTPNDTPSERMFKFMQATAGLPNQQQLAQTLLPMLNQQAINSSIGYGQGTQEQYQPMQPNQPNIGNESSQNASPNQGMNQPQQDFGYFAPNQGMIPKPQQPQQGLGQAQETSTRGQSNLRNVATNVAMQMGKDVTEIPQIMEALSPLAEAKISTQQQAEALKKSSQLHAYAKEKLHKDTSEKELNDFVRIGRQFQDLPPEEWFSKTDNKFKKYQTELNSFENANIPGFISGVLRGGKYREEQLNRLQLLAKPLVDMGEEEIVRSKLAEQGLSKTEIEGVINPLNKDVMNQIKSFTNAPYEKQLEKWSEIEEARRQGKKISKEKSYDRLLQEKPDLMNQYENKIIDFISKNVKPNTSLTNLRYELEREKNVDWRQFYKALEKSIENGLELSANQRGELSELSGAPRDSLMDIFQDTGRWIDYFRKAK